MHTMKQVILNLLPLLCGIMSFAQSGSIPQEFNYQAVLRDNNQNLLVNEAIDIRITLLSELPGDLNQYSETHQTATNEFGLINLSVGGGTPLSGNFNDLPWDRSYSMIIEWNQGNGYEEIASQTLKTVPYAQMAIQNWSIHGNGNTNDSNNFIGTTDANGFQVRTNNIPRLHVDSSGKVGIGTTSPIGDLSIVGSTNYTFMHMTDELNPLQSTFISHADLGTLIGRDGGGSIHIMNDGAPDITITDDSRVGFGTWTPDCKVQINGGSDLSLTDPNNGFLMLGTSNTMNLVMDQNEIMSRDNGQMNTLFLNTQGGAVVINQNTTPAFNFTVNGTCAKPGGGSWSALSDKRLKHKIETYHSGLEILSQIVPVSYSYTPESGYDSEIRYIGVIAQDLQKVAPSMVQERSLNMEDNPDEMYLTVDPSEFTYLLINSVKEQQSQIAELIKAVEELQIENQVMAAQLKSIAESRSDKDNH
ncbi:MAG: hypothetical protein RL220_231 [Bacteroidota bacterium]